MKRYCQTLELYDDKELIEGKHSVNHVANFVN